MLQVSYPALPPHVKVVWTFPLVGLSLKQKASQVLSSPSEQDTSRQ